LTQYLVGPERIPGGIKDATGNVVPAAHILILCRIAAQYKRIWAPELLFRRRPEGVITEGDYHHTKCGGLLGAADK
jgi:hypothetical protein